MATTEKLRREVRDRMVPAIAHARFNEFSQSVYEYGRLAGSCFADQQGGPYNGAALAAIVDHVRGLGVSGVGQSSWGPTLFAVARNQEEAVDLVRKLKQKYSQEAHSIWISRPCNRGARLTKIGNMSPAVDQSAYLSSH
jgi:predicted sugar kinase